MAPIERGQTALSKATVQRYAAELRDSGISAATINQRLSAIRKLATEASDNGALDAQIANGIKAVKMSIENIGPLKPVDKFTAESDPKPTPPVN